MSIAINLGGRFGVMCEPVHTLVNFYRAEFCGPRLSPLGHPTSLVDRNHTDKAVNLRGVSAGHRPARARAATRLAGPRVGAFWKPGDPALISFPGPAWLGAR
jgi:hypothetical protein